VFNNNALYLYDPVGGNNDGNWHHVVVTVGASNNHSIYIDGALSVTGGNANAYTDSFNWRIGYSLNNNNYFQGYVSEVAIYNTELSAARVSAHYAASL
jgi:hypothetical protein